MFKIVCANFYVFPSCQKKREKGKKIFFLWIWFKSHKLAIVSQDKKIFFFYAWPTIKKKRKKKATTNEKTDLNFILANEIELAANYKIRIWGGTEV